MRRNIDAITRGSAIEDIGLISQTLCNPKGKRSNRKDVGSVARLVKNLLANGRSAMVFCGINKRVSGKFSIVNRRTPYITAIRKKGKQAETDTLFLSLLSVSSYIIKTRGRMIAISLLKTPKTKPSKAAT